MGYVANPSLTDLGVLRPAGTPEDQQDEGLGLSRAGRRRLSRGGRSFGRGARARRARATRAQALSRMASDDPRRSLALRRMRAEGEDGEGRPVRRLGRRARQRARSAQQRREAAARTTGTRRRRRGIGGIFGRMRGRARAMAERKRAADAERAAAEALAITEAERLARETVTGPTPPTVTDRDGRIRIPPPPGTARSYRCDPRTRPPARPGGVWQCIRGNWSFQGISTTMPVRPVNGAPWPVLKAAPDGTEVPRVPSVRPWWMGRAPEGEIPLRDTSGIPTPPGLPGGPSMRPPASGPDDTATERVAAPPAAPAAGMDMAKILPLVAGAALLFMGKS